LENSQINMLKKAVTAALAAFVINLGIFASSGTTKEEKDAKNIEQAKAIVAKVGTGTDAKIEVKLKDGTVVKRYVSETNNDQFVVTNPTNDKKTTVPYPKVQKAKRPHHKLVVAALVAGFVLAIVVTLKSLR
jgi:sporulation protein YlmC with PRC-barrel domain